MKKKLLTILSLLPLLTLTACNSNEIKINPDKQHYVVGITQYVRHEALDAATLGFKESLTYELEKENRTVKFIETNAQGEPSLTLTAASSLIARNVDLIMANATASFQGAVNSTRRIPIVGTSITSYSEALGIKGEFDGIIGSNATGTTDLADMYEHAKMIFNIVPDAKDIGLLYCSSEPNSSYQVSVMKEKLDIVSKELNKDIKVKEYPFVDTNDVEQVARKAAMDSDVIYTPTDNTVASTASNIAAATKIGDKRTPIICGEEGPCRKTGIATLTISYKELGITTGKMAADILLGRKDVREMPITQAEKKTYKYNDKIREECGIPFDDRFDGYIPL